MNPICPFCKKDINKNKSDVYKSKPHNMCIGCFEHFKEQIKGLSIEKYLDKFDAPVMIVNKDGRIVASNQWASELTGKPRKEILGLLECQAFECASARLPGGCGRAVHCETCLIRRTIKETIESGESHFNVRIRFKKIADPIRMTSSEVEMIISTEKIGELVRIMIEN